MKSIITAIIWTILWILATIMTEKIENILYVKEKDKNEKKIDNIIKKTKYRN